MTGGASTPYTHAGAPPASLCAPVQQPPLLGRQPHTSRRASPLPVATCQALRRFDSCRGAMTDQSLLSDLQSTAVRGGRAYFALPNLIQQRSSAFAMGVGKLQQPAEPVSVFPHVTPQLAGECRVIQCAFDSLHLSVRPFRVIWEARDEVA